MKLLLAVDLRDDCEAVLAQAAPWVIRLDAVLDLLYVGIYADIYEFVSDPKVHALMEREAEKVRADDLTRLHELLTKVPEPLRGAVRAESGAPADVIVAGQESYDALLVATHGRKGVAKLWMGSVAERVVRTATRPVLVLHVRH